MLTSVRGAIDLACLEKVGREVAAWMKGLLSDGFDRWGGKGKGDESGEVSEMHVVVFDTESDDVADDDGMGIREQLMDAVVVVLEYECF